MSEPEHHTGEAREPELPNAHNTNAKWFVLALIALIAGALWILFKPVDEGPPVVESTAEAVKAYRPSKPPPTALPTPSTATRAPGTVSQGFVKVSAGTFNMGDSEGPRRPVTLSYSFEIQATEVTQAQFEDLMGKNPSANKQCGPKCPVESVSWFDAADFCNAMSKRMGLPQCYTRLPEKVVVKAGQSLLQCRGFRLPTEAEWEMAARAGSDKDVEGEATEVSWYDSNSGLVLHEVCTKKPNALGVCDMLGNVAEWVWDWKDDLPKEAATDPVGPAQTQPMQSKVFRGGHFRQRPMWATHGHREGYHPANKVKEIGFRCVRTLQ